jgi:hypothetical protein
MRGQYTSQTSGEEKFDEKEEDTESKQVSGNQKATTYFDEDTVFLSEIQTRYRSVQ